MSRNFVETKLSTAKLTLPCMYVWALTEYLQKAVLKPHSGREKVVSPLQLARCQHVAPHFHFITHCTEFKLQQPEFLERSHNLFISFELFPLRNTALYLRSHAIGCCVTNAKFYVIFFTWRTIKTLWDEVRLLESFLSWDDVICSQFRLTCLVIVRQQVVG